MRRVYRFRWQKQSWRWAFIPRNTPPRLNGSDIGDTDYIDRQVSTADDLKGKAKLGAILHEGLHVVFGPLSMIPPLHKLVMEAEIMLTDLLWRFGYRCAGE